MNAPASRWIKRIMTAAGFPALKEEVRAVSGRLGFQHFAFRGRFPGHAAPDGEHAFDSFTATWLDPARAHALAAAVEAMRSRALEDVTPLLWRELLGRKDGATIGDGTTLRGTGATFPVHGPAGQWSALTMLRTPAGVAAEQEILASLAECQLLAAYVHGATARLLRRQARDDAPAASALLHVALSERERQCLSLSAAGNTAAEAAQQLAISERTVVFHLANARRKLGAHHSSQAVLRALAMGLISASDAVAPAAPKRA